MYSSANNITEDQNLYRCEPWVKIKIFNIGFLYFQFVWGVMPKQNYIHFLFLFMGPHQDVFKMTSLVVMWRRFELVVHKKSG